MINLHDFPKIEGRYINFREAEVEDSAFILSLRADPKKARFIHKTDNDLQKQMEYMKHYKTLSDEWYYIVESKEGEPLGTQSIYPYPMLHPHWISEQNPSKGILGPGRWLMKDGLSPLIGLESDYLIKKLFFEDFNMAIEPMMIHENNTNVLSFHMKWGAKIIGWSEEEKHHLLELSKDDYEKNKPNFERMLY